MEVSSRALSAHKRNKSDAVPLHMLRLPIMVRTQVASGVGLYDALDGRSAVGRVGTGESAGRPERGFARRGPEREIRHARQPIEPHLIDGPQSMHHPIEKCAQDAGTDGFEFAPKLGFPHVDPSRQWAPNSEIWHGLRDPAG
jgi:hypothetical protein